MTPRQRVFGTLFIGYAGYYLCRVNLPVALPLIEEQYGFTKTATGLLLSLYFASYSISKVVNGVLADRLGGKSVVLIGMAGSVSCNVAFGFGSSWTVLALLWSANAYFQSMGWLGLVSVMSQWYNSRESGRAMGLMSLSYQIGDFFARSLAGLLLLSFLWPQMFWAHAALLAGVGGFVWMSLEPTPVSARPDAVGIRAGAWRARMLRRPQFWFVVGIALVLSVIRYVFWGWSVQYLRDSGLSITWAALTSALFPFTGSLGSIFAGWLSDHMGARRGPVVLGMTALLTLSLYAFSKVPVDAPLGLALTLALIGFSLYGPYALLTGAVALDFGGKAASGSAAGIIDGVGALGSVFTGVGMGYLVERYGWESAFLVVVSMGAATTALSSTLWRMRPSMEHN